MPTRPSDCDLSALVDHARGLGSTADRARLEAHLATCAACRHDLAGFARMAVVARADLTEHPGAAAMQRALALGAAAAPEPWTLVPRWLGQLVSGGLQPALVGLRSAEEQRLGVFHAGPYAVRVRVEEEPGETQLSVIGQIEARDALRPVDALSVLITSGTRVLGRSDTNTHGEFELSCEPLRQLRLHVLVDGGARRLEMPLARLLPEDPA